jgi:hypothetical protein
MALSIDDLPVLRLNAPNREAWLSALVEAWRPTVAKVGDLPPVRIACGFPSRRALSRNAPLGQCWSRIRSADHTTEIFISPLLDDAFAIAHTVLHELIHAVVGVEHGHKSPFRRAARRAGLVGRPTATVPSDELTALIHSQILPELGPYPHARLSALCGERRQKARLFKGSCETTGYAVWSTRKWLRSFGPPVCPCCSNAVVMDYRAGARRLGESTAADESDGMKGGQS